MWEELCQESAWVWCLAVCLGVRNLLVLIVDLALTTVWLWAWTQALCLSSLRSLWPATPRPPSHEAWAWPWVDDLPAAVAPRGVCDRESLQPDVLPGPGSSSQGGWALPQADGSPATLPLSRGSKPGPFPACPQPTHMDPIQEGKADVFRVQWEGHGKGKGFMKMPLLVWTSFCILGARCVPQKAAGIIPVLPGRNPPTPRAGFRTQALDLRSTWSCDGACIVQNMICVICGECPHPRGTVHVPMSHSMRPEASLPSCVTSPCSPWQHLAPSECSINIYWMNEWMHAYRHEWANWATAMVWLQWGTDSQTGQKSHKRPQPEHPGSNFLPPPQKGRVRLASPTGGRTTYPEISDLCVFPASVNAWAVRPIAGERWEMVGGCGGEGGRLVFFRISKNEQNKNTHLVASGIQNSEWLEATTPSHEWNAKRAEGRDYSSPWGIFIFFVANLFKMLHHKVRLAYACSISDFTRFWGDTTRSIRLAKIQKWKRKGRGT